MLYPGTLFLPGRGVYARPNIPRVGIVLDVFVVAVAGLARCPTWCTGRHRSEGRFYCALTRASREIFDRYVDYVYAAKTPSDVHR